MAKPKQAAARPPAEDDARDEAQAEAEAAERTEAESGPEEPADARDEAVRFREAQTDGDMIYRRAGDGIGMRPNTVNREARTAELVVSTGAPVRRYDWRQGREFIEELEISASAIRMARMNDGRAPFLDAHFAWSVGDMLGAVVPGTARIVGKELRATVKFSTSPLGEQALTDAEAGILRNVSVGYRVHKWEMDETKSPPIRRATDWEPLEVSAVPIGADPKAGFRSIHPGPTPATMERAMPQETAQAGAQPAAIETSEAARTAPPAQRTAEPPAPAPAAVPPAPAPNADEATRAAVEAERARIAEIHEIAAQANAGRAEPIVADEFVRKHIADGTKPDEVRRLVLRQIADHADKTASRPRVSAGDADEDQTRRDAIVSALLHRHKPDTFELTEAAREWRGMTLIEMAREFLTQNGIRTRGLTRSEIANLAMQTRTGGMMSSSDFPAILADVANKTLRQAYEAAPQTFRPFCRRVTAVDFKPINRVQLGEAPKLEKVNEHGEYKRGSIAEGKESYSLATFGKVVAITRKTIINDDLDAFTRIPGLFGQSIADLESDTVWAVITGNPAMGDGVVLFHATHKNLGTAGVPSDTTLGEGRKLMRLQKGLDGKTTLNVAPRFFLFPASLETTVDKLLATLYPAATTNAVPSFVRSLTPISEPRLDAASVASWYLAASPDQIDTIEYCYLEGQEGAYIETRMGFDVDGVEVKCRLDFAAAPIDFRGFMKNNGA